MAHGSARNEERGKWTPPRDFAETPLADAHLPQLIVRDECEAKYFLSREILSRNIDLTNLRATRIRQDYLTDEAFARFVPALLRAHGWSERSTTQFRQARVRAEIDAEHTIYSIELKGSRQGWHRRVELSIPVSADFYRLMRQFALGGAIEKIRYYLPLQVRSTSGGSAEAHFDFVIGAGRSGRFTTQTPPTWCTVDIEAAEQHIAAIRQAHIDHAWIVREGIELIREDNPGSCIAECQRALATRRLAKKGLDDKAQRAIRKLSKKLKN